MYARSIAVLDSYLIDELGACGLARNLPTWGYIAAPHTPATRTTHTHTVHGRAGPRAVQPWRYIPPASSQRRESVVMSVVTDTGHALQLPPAHTPHRTRPTLRWPLLQYSYETLRALLGDTAGGGVLWYSGGLKWRSVGLKWRSAGSGAKWTFLCGENDGHSAPGGGWSPRDGENDGRSPADGWWPK